MKGGTESVIEVKDLVASYDGRTVLDGVTFDVRRAEILCVLGGSGSGKSTLLKHMIGLYPPVSGSIQIRGMDLASSDGAERIAILNAIGVMYQGGALFGSMTLLQNVRLPLEEFTALPDEAIDLIARIKLRLVGLHEAAERMPSELSGGMQKRAAIARAMALDPEIVFLDEPSAGLDPITSAELDRTIVTLSRGLGITFVVVTHELDSIFAIADRCIMLDSRVKKIVAEGDPREMKRTATDPWIRRFFNPTEHAGEEGGGEA